MNNRFILLPEWSPHEATWIGWPYNKSDWPGKFSPIILSFLLMMMLPSEYSPDLIIIVSKSLASFMASVIVLIEPDWETIISLEKVREENKIQASKNFNFIWRGI